MPIRKATQVLKKLLEADTALAEKTNLSKDSIMEMTEFCLNNAYYEVDNTWYKINCGMIGLDLMGVVADIYMEDHEIRAVRTAQNPPEFQTRYVDDYYLGHKYKDSCKKNNFRATKSKSILINYESFLIYSKLSIILDQA